MLETITFWFSHFIAAVFILFSIVNVCREIKGYSAGVWLEAFALMFPMVGICGLVSHFLGYEVLKLIDAYILDPLDLPLFAQDCQPLLFRAGIVLGFVVWGCGIKDVLEDFSNIFAFLIFAVIAGCLGGIFLVFIAAYMLAVFAYVVVIGLGIYAIVSFWKRLMDN